MANNSFKTFTASGSWTAPAGVTSVKVVARTLPNPFPQVGGAQTPWCSGIVDPYGNMYSWGYNNNGQLGVGDTTGRSSPTLVLGGQRWVSFATQIGGPADVTQPTVLGAINYLGQAYMWGLNGSGGLGNGNQTLQSSPVAVLGGLVFASLYTGTASGPGSTWGLAASGAAYGWGFNGQGQLGIGSVAAQSSPVAVLGGLTFSKLFPGGNANTNTHVVGLTTSGAAYGWGFNGQGQLGIGSVAAQSSPVAVLGGLTFTSIANGCDTQGSAFFVGLTSIGAAYAWGANHNGQLGLGDVASRSSPVLVLGGLTFSSVYVSQDGAVLGLTAAGAAYAWGNNVNGQLGVGDVTPRSSPVAVLGGLSFSSIVSTLDSVTSASSTLGITTSGTAYAWGFNAAGQLGVGDVTPRSSPVAVLGGLSFQSAYGSFGGFIAAAANSGRLYGWGFNGSGGLGDGTNTSRSSPVAVLGLQSGGFLESVREFFVQVTPGTAYTITMGLGQVAPSFGSTQLVPGANAITLEYFS